MNKKGFVLAETLVMSAVIVVLLSVCYYPFSSIVNNNKTYRKYDNIEDIYKLNNVRMFIYKYIGMKNILEGNIGGSATIDNTGIIPFYSSNNIDIQNDDKNIKEKYIELLDVLGIESLYITKYNLSSDKIDNKTFSYEMKEYLKYINNAKTVNSSGEEVNMYRLVAKFKDDTYGNIKMWSEE